MHIRVDETAGGGVVVAGLEVVESGLFVVVVAAVTQGVDLCQGAGSGQDLAVGIVGVGRHDLLIAIQDGQNIALEVGDIVVGGTVVGQGVGMTALVIEEVQSVAAPGLPHQLTTGIEIAVGGVADFLGQPQTVGIVGEGERLATAVGGDQSPSLFPGHCPPGAVIVAGRIARVIVGDRLSIKGSEQILPDGVAVGVGVDGSSIGGGEDITHTVVGVGVGLTATGLAEQLVLGVVSIGVGGAVLRVSGDVPQLIVGIAVGMEHIPGSILILIRTDLPGGLGGADIPVGVVAV